MKKYFKIFIIILPFSLLLFFSIFHSLSSLKSASVIERKNYINIEDDIMNYNKLLTECLEKTNYNVLIDCDTKIREAELKITTSENHNIMIIIIYIFMVITLNIQLSIFIYTYVEKEKIDKLFFDLSDWAINAPPMLGVLGTIVSFALLVGGTDSGSIEETFKKYFFDAAITTILGGIIYVLNSLLKVKIHTRIK